MNTRTKRTIEAIIFISLGIGLAAYTIFDSLDGSFYAGSKYGSGNTLSIENGETGYWFAVSFRVLLGSLCIYLGLLSIRDIKKNKNPYD